MKKILSYAAPLAMAMTISVGLPAPAQADNNGAKDTVAFCKAIAGGTDFSVGECVSYFRTEDPVQTCKLLKAFGILDALGVNFGQCVSYAHH